MNALTKVLEAQSILIEKLGSDISSIKLNKRGKELKVKLTNGITIYIVYNNYNQYSYSIIYTQSKYDRIRFDNFDNRWNVLSKPHHLHKRGSRFIEESPMKGDPKTDIDKIIKLLNE